MIVEASWENIDELFEGVMVPSGDKPSGRPGWKCRSCGWTIGSIDLPPKHQCPADGMQQWYKHERQKTDPTEFNQEFQCVPWEQPCMHDQCPKCHGTGYSPSGPCIHNLACNCPKCSPRC